MMQRRFFLKLTGFVAAASAFGALPAAAQVQTEAAPAVPNDASGSPVGRNRAIKTPFGPDDARLAPPTTTNRPAASRTTAAAPAEDSCG